LCDEYLAAARAGLVMTRFRRPKRTSTIDIDEAPPPLLRQRQAGQRASFG
jgi:hypothetical protein